MPSLDSRVGSRKGKNLKTLIRGNAVGPQDIPKVQRCSSKLNWGKDCSYMKVVLNCSHLCKKGHGVLCPNTSADENKYDSSNHLKHIELCAFSIYF